MRCQPLRRALCLIHKNQLVVLLISLAFRSGFVGIVYCNQIMKVQELVLNMDGLLFITIQMGNLHL